MKKFLGILVGLGGLFLLAKGFVQFLSTSSSEEAVTLIQNVTLTAGQCLIFGVVALILGAILIFVL